MIFVPFVSGGRARDRASTAASRRGALAGADPRLAGLALLGRHPPARGVRIRAPAPGLPPDRRRRRLAALRLQGGPLGPAPAHARLRLRDDLRGPRDGRRGRCAGAQDAPRHQGHQARRRALPRARAGGVRVGPRDPRRRRRPRAQAAGPADGRGRGRALLARLAPRRPPRRRPQPRPPGDLAGVRGLLRHDGRGAPREDRRRRRRARGARLPDQAAAALPRRHRLEDRELPGDQVDPPHHRRAPAPGPARALRDRPGPRRRSGASMPSPRLRERAPR